ncbi:MULTISPECIES: hypothetical protein [unclassified Pseudomonas]|uniref:hypothetical protein n=1 Tax=unclassified Pseudomonas TaxID=196821 RepID=UPI002AC95042|nr:MULTISPECIES: hypothetical protein [unclassified Pseudomonas]MEB0048134.1 hypothetical protein [Pseudomonas sp. Dout3]MEB0099160.1 hypothetical protein [Pseudomonas sp. DC1.2]WPX61636.1 hypothetical protein RHM68_18180 [Pseudomonas sp. DC1.2]
MALIECYECNKSISSEATACIHCGAPAAAVKPSTSPASPISFGHLPRDEKVAKVTPAAFGRRVRSEGTLAQAVPQTTPSGLRPVENWLKIMVFLLPPFFVWFLLRRGHSLKQRLIGFGWLGLMILLSKG